MDAVKLRYAFIPYIYSTSWQITSADGSLMRPLMMDFAADRRTWEIGHEFMFGKDVLVAPVVKAQFTPEDPQPKGKFDAEVDFSGTRPYEVYLPAGTGWYDFQSEKLLSGGSDIEINTALSDIPIYVREGSILPIGPDVTHSDMKGWTNLEIRVYPGADGKFTLYEDEGDGYYYEKGAYSTIDFVWNDASSELTIYDRKGSFDGMLQGRNFTVRLVGSAYPVLVEYSGKQLSVRL